MITNTLYQLLLVHFADGKCLDIDDLVRRTLPKRTTPPLRAAWAREVEIACEILRVRNYVRAEDSGTGRRYIARPRTLSLLPQKRPLGAARLAAPLAAVVAMNGCATGPASNGNLRSYWGNESPGRTAPLRAETQPTGTRTDRITDSSGGVYRLCYDDCPKPRVTPPTRAAQLALASPQEAAAPAPVAAANATASDREPGAISPESRIIRMDDVMRQSIVATLNEQFGKPAVPIAEPAADEPSPPKKAEPTPKHRRSYLARKATRPATESASPEPAEPATVTPIQLDTITAAEPETVVKPRVARRYVGPRIDPNEEASPENRSKVERMMQELRDGVAPAAGPAAGKTTSEPGTGMVSSPDMRELSTTVAVAKAADALAEAPADSPQALLDAWGAAWGDRDPERYFAFYSDTFVPQSGRSPRSFFEARRTVMMLAEHINVGVTPVKSVVSGNRAVISFWQQYTSNRFRSRVLKTLELERVGAEWKIRRERVVHMSNAQPRPAA